MAGPTSRRTRNTRTNDTVDAISSGTGIYIGRVVNHLDQKFMGSLQVQLLKVREGGNDFQESGQLITCHYASPFSGQTPLQNVGANNTYAESQQSYGFWAVPPDVGTKVIVVKVEGAADFGFWIGCVQDEYMNFMIPDGRPATNNNNEGTKLPVGEYNKALVEPDGELQPTRYPKPVNTDFVESLAEQGLLEDDVRGLTSSSARREVPSAVFGINTPGPLDKRNGAPRNLRGATGQEANVPSSRLGGTSIVMDDGDDKILRTGSPEDSPSEYVDIENSSGSGDNTRPANELFRVRTRTGHQILLHNTEDLIYIGNARGTSWIEMSSNGKIDIFAEDSISVHTGQDINFTADRDINFNAAENINMSAGNKIKTTAGSSLDFTSIDYTSFIAGGSYTAKADSYISLASSKIVSIEGANNVDISSAGSSVNLSASKFVNVSGKTGIKMGSSGDAHMKIGGNIFQETNSYHINSQEFFAYAKGQLNLKSDADMFLNSAVTMNIKGKSAYLNSLSGDVHIKSGADVKINAVADINSYAVNVLRNATANIQDRAAASIDVQSTGGYIRLNASTTIDVKSGTDMKITGNTMDLKTLGGVLIAEASTNLKLEGALVQIDAGDTATAATAGSASIAKTAIGAQSATPATVAIKPNPVTPQTPVSSLISKIPSRIPQHEPWLQHENLNPLEYVPEKTRAGIESVDSFSQPIPDTFINIGTRDTSGATTASDRSTSSGFTPPTDGEYSEEELGDFKDLERDTIYVVGDFHAAGIQSAGGFNGSPNSSATVEQIASNQVGRIPENSVVIVAAGVNSADSNPEVVKKAVQEKIVDPLLLKNCYVLFVNYPNIDLAGSYASAYDRVGLDANYNAVRSALDQVSANGTIDLLQSDIDPADPRKLRATSAAYQRVVSAAEGAVSAIPDPSPFDQYSGTLGPLLAAIRICEVDDASPRGYDIVYGGIPSNKQPPRPITQMTAGEVNTWQYSIRPTTSTAAGAYQFVSDTLKELLDSGVVSRSAKFDAATQDTLCIALMKNLQSWKDGQTSDERFGYGLAKVWASMPVMIVGVGLSKGRTSTTVNNAYYGGVATNPSIARRPASFIKDALVRSKEGSTQENEETEVTLTPDQLAALGFEAGDPYQELETRGTFTAPAVRGTLENTARVRQRQGQLAGFRYLPVQTRMIDVLNRAANASGCYVHISSGGQMPYAEWANRPASQRDSRRPNSRGVDRDFYVRGTSGEWVKARTGSRRHDTGLAVDCKISRDDSPTSTNWINYNFNSKGQGADNQLWDNFIYFAFKFGCRGFGFSPGYMGVRTIHLDLLGQYSGGSYNNNVLGHWSNTASYFQQIAQRGINDA